MPNTREKLIELLVNCEDIVRSWDGTYGEAADHLIANDVTVQKWISVKDRLPTEEDASERGWVLAYSNDNRHIIADYKSVILFSHLISHWKVLTSPQPPKGE